MSSYIQKLTESRLISLPKWLPGSVIYEVLIGSVAYGVSSDTSDMDIYGICIPHKEDIQHKHLAEGKSTFGENIREGFTVRPEKERRYDKGERLYLKIHGEQYLLHKGKLK